MPCICIVECGALQTAKTVFIIHRRVAKMELHKSITAIDKNLMDLRHDLLQVCENIHNIRLALNELCGFPVENAENVFKKVSHTLQKSISNLENAGGDYRGGRDMGLKGKREGGELRGGNLVKTPSENALSYYPDDIKLLHEYLLMELMRGKISEQQFVFIQEKKQVIHSLKTLCKLRQLGYSDDAIKQAVFNAFRDAFWQEQFKHIKALSNTSKNGSLVIDNLLKINRVKTKITTPKNIIF